LVYNPYVPPVTSEYIFLTSFTVRSLEFDTVNLSRLELLLQHYFAKGSMLSVREGNVREPLTFSWR
jgi:hypothetical protein